MREGNEMGEKKVRELIFELQQTITQAQRSSLRKTLTVLCHLVGPELEMQAIVASASVGAAEAVLGDLMIAALDQASGAEPGVPTLDCDAFRVELHEAMEGVLKKHLPEGAAVDSFTSEINTETNEVTVDVKDQPEKDVDREAPPTQPRLKPEEF